MTTSRYGYVIDKPYEVWACGYIKAGAREYGEVNVTGGSYGGQVGAMGRHYRVWADGCYGVQDHPATQELL